MRPGDTRSATATWISFPPFCSVFGPRPYPNQNQCGFYPYLRNNSLYGSLSFGAIFEKQLQFSGSAKRSTDPLNQKMGNKKCKLLAESIFITKDQLSTFFKGCFMMLSMMPKILADLYPSYFIYQFFCYSKGFTTYYILD